MGGRPAGLIPSHFPAWGRSALPAFFAASALAVAAAASLGGVHPEQLFGQTLTTGPSVYYLAYDGFDYASGTPLHGQASQGAAAAVWDSYRFPDLWEATGQSSVRSADKNLANGLAVVDVGASDNLVVEATISRVPGRLDQRVGVAVLASADQNGYSGLWVVYERNTGALQIRARSSADPVDDPGTVLAQAAVGTYNQIDLAVDVSQPTITVYLNGSQALSHTLSPGETQLYGQATLFGLYGWRPGGARWEVFSVTSY